MPEQGLQQTRTSPWARPRFIVAAAVLAVIAVLAVALAVLRPAPDPGTALPAPAEPAPPPAPVDGGPSYCGLPTGDGQVPVVPPTATNWELVGTMAAPTAPTVHGPGVTEEGLRSCYARSPLGALYAATGFLAAASDPALRLRAVQQLTAAGEGRDRALDLLEETDPGPESAGLQVVGFTFLNYDPAVAVVDVAMSVDATAVHLPITVRWEDGDWKVALPVTGQPFEAIAALPNLTGYVPWAGA
jgi:hypothetical protein